MTVSNAFFNFLTDVFTGIYEYGSDVYYFLAHTIVIDGQEQRLTEWIFGPALVTLLSFLIIKGLIK